MPETAALLPLLGVLLLLLVFARDAGLAQLERLEQAVYSRYAPLIAGVAASLFMWWHWGSLAQVPTFHDEMAYLLQAEIFASGRLAAPPPPIPEFFEQYHVFVEPTFSPKYPPGHALLLAPGIWLGLPGLVPVLLSGVTAAILFHLARRVSSHWVALLTLVLWLVAPLNLRFRASYFSEVTTAALWLVAWYALSEYRDRGRGRWLALLVAAVAWGAITRPLTMLAFAVPTGLAALAVVIRRRSWRHVVYALPLGLAIVAVLPLWSARVIGDWRKSPHAEYARLYIPADRMGFGVDSAPPARALPDDMTRFADWVRKQHVGHTAAAAPGLLLERLTTLGAESWGRGALTIVGAAAAVAGLFTVPAAVSALALGACVALVLAYLIYAHPLGWQLYYLETVAVLCFLAAAGLIAAAKLAITRLPLAGAASQSARAAYLPVAALLVVALAWLPAPSRVVKARMRLGALRGYQHDFRTALASLPPGKAIVFVRYGADHDPHSSILTNSADFRSSRLWIAYDRGADNARLLAVAPDRTAYLYEESIVNGQMRRVLGLLPPTRPRTD